jgi:hypothetical protein
MIIGAIISNTTVEFPDRGDQDLYTRILNNVNSNTSTFFKTIEDVRQLEVRITECEILAGRRYNCGSYVLYTYLMDVYRLYNYVSERNVEQHRAMQKFIDTVNDILGEPSILSKN